MTPPDPVPNRSTSLETLPLTPRHTWFQRVRQRAATPVAWGQLWQSAWIRRSRKADPTVEQSLARYSITATSADDRTPATRISLARRLEQLGRRISTPVESYRPHTAPSDTRPITFRPIRWESRGEDTLRSYRASQNASKPRCPYDPTVLQFFDDFETSHSFCGLNPGWPWSTERQIPTPCDDCLNGTDRAHINVSPSRFLRTHSQIQQRRDPSSNVRERRGSASLLKHILPNVRTRQSSRVRASRQDFPGVWDFSERPPERMGHRLESSREATFNRLRQVVLDASLEPSVHRTAPPRLHQLSPNIAFVHRNEVPIHQAAIRSGRESPILQHQARGRSPVDVVGYAFNPDRRDSSSTALYSGHISPGEYIPPSPREIPSPALVLSPLRRQIISLEPVDRPVLVSRLNQPPFVPALPEGTVLRPMKEWGRPRSAPDDWETVLRRSTVYRAVGTDHSPRVPSPLHEQHRAESFTVESSSDEEDWDHGTMPGTISTGNRNAGDGASKRGSTPYNSKEPRLRGGGEDYFSLPLRGKVDVELHEGQSSPEAASCCSPYYHDEVSVEDHKHDAFVQLTTGIPRLRGGGKPVRRSRRIPASLFYLAGATGKNLKEPITGEEWNRMKPTHRMGGLLGMAVYGHKAGRPYVPTTRDQVVQTDTQIASSETVELGSGAGWVLQSTNDVDRSQESRAAVENSAHPASPTPGTPAPEQETRSTAGLAPGNMGDMAPPYPDAPRESGASGAMNEVAHDRPVQMPPTPGDMN